MFKISSSVFTDPRDGRTYKTTQIGEQVWMAENLAFDIADSKCYDNVPSNCEKYGRLYNWETANKAVPLGWHLPTDEEWENLINFVGGFSVAGMKLKAIAGWRNDGNGTDEYGFSALPGGDNCRINKFWGIRINGGWWTSTECDAKSAYHRGMGYSYDGVSRYNYYKETLFSVRCVKEFSIKRLASEPIVEKYKTYFAGNKNSLTATDSSKEQKDGTNRNFRME